MTAKSLSRLASVLDARKRLLSVRGWGLKRTPPSYLPELSQSRQRQTGYSRLRGVRGQGSHSAVTRQEEWASASCMKFSKRTRPSRDSFWCSQRVRLLFQSSKDFSR